MHPRNRYSHKKPDFAHLASTYPSFAPFVRSAKDGYASIDFQDSKALRALTRVLLKEDWGYEVELREDRLCPTPTDYLYHILDMVPYLCSPISDVDSSSSSISAKRPLKVLDIGTGHVAIYPLLLHRLSPDTQIIATVSFHHSLQTRIANNIPSSSISIRRPAPDQPIVFPIFASVAEDTADDRRNGLLSSEREKISKWDFVICNPPFFGSGEEMRQGISRKNGAAPAAPTAAENELITPGGEEQFVGQMIDESLELGEACQWYTSLIGKYSSLMGLVAKLRKLKIDNYFVKVSQQSRTARWILGWSHSSHRLPDSISRPAVIIPGTSFAKILPLPNTFSHTLSPSTTLSELRNRIEEILRDVQILTEGHGATSASSIFIAPRSHSWSRAARRHATRSLTIDGQGATASVKTEDAPPLFRAEIRFVDALPIVKEDTPKVSASEALVEDSEMDGSGPMGSEGEKKAILILETSEKEEKVPEQGSKKLELFFPEGKDWGLVDGLWKYIISKAKMGE